jgi:hypothetical protein
MDHEQAEAFALAIAAGDSDEARALVRWLELRTRRLVAFAPHWCAIEAVAEALLTHETLDGQRLRALVQEAIR